MLLFALTDNRIEVELALKVSKVIKKTKQFLLAVNALSFLY